MKLAFLGLGKMGSRMVEKLIRDGHEVVAWNRTFEVTEHLQNKVQSAQFRASNSIKEAIEQLENQKIVWLMLPAGDTTESVLSEVSQFVKTGDIVIDGGNSKFSDTETWAEKFLGGEVRFLGIGVSGGIVAAENGYPLMVGGDKSAYQEIVPILDTLAKPQGGHEYFGRGGAGHFVKMVHNAIEYSYMQGIGEGFGVLENADYNFDLSKVARLYTKNTLVSGFMMDRTVDSLKQDPRLEQITGVIGSASGETVWTVDVAKKNDLFIENIEQALEFRRRSDSDPKIQKSFAARMVAALRREFGGHTIKKK